MTQAWWLCYFACALELPFPVLYALNFGITLEQLPSIDWLKLSRQRMDWTAYWEEWEDTYGTS